MLYKLGAVPYLNARPLIHYLKDPPRLEPPAALARLLRIGEVDIATAPIVTLFENPHYTLVPGICIGSDGPVQSVKLFFTSPDTNAHNVKSISLDLESRTSILLLKTLLKFKFGRNLDDITFDHPLPPRQVEARLLIGDKAMKEIAATPCLDLGQEWTDWTKLPFVYAAWISRHASVSERAIEELTEARDRGASLISSVIPTNSPVPFDTARAYLENLVYTLGEREMKGLTLFREYLLQSALLVPSLHHAAG